MKCMRHGSLDANARRMLFELHYDEKPRGKTKVNKLHTEGREAIRGSQQATTTMWMATTTRIDH